MPNLHAVRSQVQTVWGHPANRGRRSRQVGHAIWIRVRRQLGLRSTTPIGSGFKAYVWPDLPSSMWPALGNPCDFREMMVWRQVLAPGSTFVDVGAHLGFYTLEALSLGAEVVAFEPSDRLVARLRDNLALNKSRAEVHRAGVSDRPGRSVLSGPDHSRKHLEPVQDPGDPAEVDVVTLDDVLGERSIDGLKIDVEGHERRVLAGARKLLSEHRVGLVQLEWNVSDPEDRSAIGRLLADADYELLVATDDGDLHRLDPTEPAPLNVFARPIRTGHTA